MLSIWLWKCPVQEKFLGTALWDYIGGCMSMYAYVKTDIVYIYVCVIICMYIHIIACVHMLRYMFILFVSFSDFLAAE
jgi:hypothetical protein